MPMAEVGPAARHAVLRLATPLVIRYIGGDLSPEDSRSCRIPA